MRARILWAILGSIFLTGCATTSLETIHVPMKGTGWKVGHAQDAGEGKGTITEFVLVSQSVHDWSRMITIQFLEGVETEPSTFMRGLRESMISRCPDVFWNVINEDSTGIVYEWRIEACDPHQDQHEIAKLAKGNDGLHRVSYTEKVPKLLEPDRERWVNRISQSYVKKSGKRITLNSNKHLQIDAATPRD